jgi:hypothetical protein
VTNSPPYTQVGSSATPPIENFYGRKSEASAEGQLVVDGLRSGVRAIVEACVRTKDAVQRFPDDQPELVDAFLAALVEGNIISRSEARLGKSSPKLSKFKTIGGNADMLLDDRIFHYLGPSLSLIYQVTVLRSILSGSEEDCFEQLVAELAALSPLSRERVSVRCEEIKRAKKSSPTLPSVTDKGESHASVSVTPVTGVGGDYKAVLLTPDRARDFGRISEDYAEDPTFARLANELLGADAVAVVTARLADIPLLQGRLLPVLGFSYLSRVYLVRAPTDADVTDAAVVLVAHREENAFTSAFAWIANEEGFTAKALVERLLPGVGRKLHLFASDDTQGSPDEWLSVVGDANWSSSDE